MTMNVSAIRPLRWAGHGGKERDRDAVNNGGDDAAMVDILSQPYADLAKSVELRRPRSSYLATQRIGLGRAYPS